MQISYEMVPNAHVRQLFVPLAKSWFGRIEKFNLSLEITS